MPEGSLSPPEQAEALSRAIEQMDGYDQMLGAREEGQVLPVVLTGQVPSDGLLEQELQAMLQREVLPPSPPVVVPEDFPIAQNATNVGLALLDLSRPKGLRQAPAISPNLLSERHVPRPLPVVPTAVFLVLALFAVAVFNMTPRVDDRVAEADAALEEMVTRQSEYEQFNRNLNPIRKLRNDARQVRQLTLALQTRLGDLGEELKALRPLIDRIETITGETKPASVDVSGVTPSGNNFRLRGTAPSLEDVKDYVDNIRDSGLFIDVSFEEIGSSGTQASSGAPTTIESLLGGGEPAPAGAQAAGVRLSFVITATARPSPGQGGSARSR